MKNIRLLMCAIFALMASCVFAQNSFSQQLIARAMAAQAADECPKSGIQDLGDKLVLTAAESYGAFWVAVVITAEFDGDQPDSKCIKCTQETKSDMPGIIDEEDAFIDLTDGFEGLTKEMVLTVWKELYGDLIVDDGDDDDEPTPGEGENDQPEDLVTAGYIQDLGDKLVVKFRTESESTGYWGEGVITAEFDGSDEESICINCYSDAKSNIPGEEEVHEDMTEEMAGLTKAQVRIIFTMMLNIIEDAPDALSAIEGDAQQGAVYNVNGQLLPSLQKGINVVNGRVVIVR